MPIETKDIIPIPAASATQSRVVLWRPETLQHAPVNQLGLLTTSGGTMTGGLTIDPPASTAGIILDKASGTSSQSSRIQGQMNGSLRWIVDLGDASSEAAGNVGSDFTIYRYDNASTYLGSPLSISRANGTVTLGSLSVSGAISAAGSIYGYYFQPSSYTGLYMNGTTTTGSNPIYQDNVIGNPAWSACYMEAVHYPGVWAGWQWNAGGVLSTFRNDGNWYKAAAGGFLAASDERIKTVLHDYEPGLDAIRQLQPVRFLYKGNETNAPPSRVDDTTPPDPEQPETKMSREALVAPYANSMHFMQAEWQEEFTGLIAQQVEAAGLYDLVTKSEAYIDGEPVDDLRHLDTTNLIYALINAVKELAARIEALEDKP